MNKTSFGASILRYLIGITFGIMITGCQFISKKNPVWKLILLKGVVPTTLGNIYMFGIVRYQMGRLGLINCEEVSPQTLAKEFKEEQAFYQNTKSKTS